MPANYPGLDTWPANIAGAVALDPAAGTEHGPTAVSQLANRTRRLANIARAIIADFDFQQVADATSVYATHDSTASTSWDFLNLQISLTAEIGDLLIACAQVTGMYTGANFGEMRLADKSNAVVSPQARWGTTLVREGRVIMMYQEVANAAARTIDLEGQVKTAGSLQLDGAALLWGVVLRKAPVLP